MPRVYIGLGSNLDAPRRQVETALQELRDLPECRWIANSPLYRSRPVGPQDQPDYVNAVAAVDTDLDAEALLDALQAVERRHGRRRGRRWGERTLDLDILLYGEETIHSDRLRVPHPEMHRRGFVLKPLYDLAPELIIPGLGRIETVLRQVDTSDLEPLPDAG